MLVIRELQFPLELDQLTRGLGNCMIIALLQQCRRPEISRHLPPGIKTLSSQTITTSTSTSFRIAVRDFVMASSEDQRVGTLRENFQGLSGTSSWTDHWQKLVQDTVWGDAIFLWCAAYFLKIDILIINAQSSETNPYTHLVGREDGGSPDIPDMCVGYTGNHYQSLLPLSSTAASVSSILSSPQKAAPPPAQPVLTPSSSPVPVGFSLGSPPILTPDEAKKKKDRERQREYRARKKAKKTESQPAEQPSSEEVRLAEKKEKNRLRQAEYRA